ncbi:MAG TPA: hypothetical protein EYP10_03655, partial [Armatimonadetes bacterium]|nr:hypothetical protein [Armatimonadota bacterium]
YKKRRYINILNADAVRAFIELTHEAYAQRIPNIGNRICAIFTDEPSLMTTYIRPRTGALPALPWVEDLLEQFKRRKGYELQPYLESLFADVDDYRGVRCDFYEVIGQLIAERYFGQIQKWCHAHGIASSGHLLAEERLLWHVMYYGDFFACLKRMDIPGIDMLTSDPKAIVNGRGFIVPKLISSAAHIMERYETMSETSDYVQRRVKKRATLTEMQATANILYLLGINTITSYYAHPFGDARARKDYARYNIYVGRLSVLLRNALHVCNLAVLYPIAGIWANFYPTALSMYQPHPNERLMEIDEQFVHLCRMLLQNQLDFDIVDEAAIQSAVIADGRFRIGKESYRALVIPTTDAIHLATLQRIAEMVNEGIFVIGVGKMPTFAASHNEKDAEVKALSQKLFRAERWMPQADSKLVQALRAIKCSDVSIEPPIPHVWIAHYLRDGMHIYFVINVSNQLTECTIMLRDCNNLMLWNPDTGDVHGMKITMAQGYGRVSLTLQPYQGVFLTHE